MEISAILYQNRYDISTDNTSNGLNECAMDNSSNNNCNSETTMKTISMVEYTRLVQNSIEICKAKKTIDKLTKSIEKKDAALLKLENKLKLPNLSHVSL